MTLKIYLAGKMTGIQHFNRQAFLDAATTLRAEGHVVFTPTEYSEAVYGPDILLSNETGDPKQADAMGFDHKKMFMNELAFILQDADAVVILEGWESSKGATAERAVALAVGIPVLEYSVFIQHKHDARMVN